MVSRMTSYLLLMCLLGLCNSVPQKKGTLKVVKTVAKAVKTSKEISDLCKPSTDVETTGQAQEVACRVFGGHQAEQTCSGGFPETLPPGVVKLTIQDANLGMLGYRRNGQLSAFIDSSQLETLVLRNLSVTATCRDVFSTVPKLKILDLSYNKLTSLDILYFQHLTHLEELDLSYNAIATITTNTFVLCQSLKKLILSFNQLQEFSADLPYSLTTLNLASNQIYALSESFALPSLETLDLCNNPLRNFGIQLNMPALTKVCITDYDMGTDILQNLQAPAVKQLKLTAPEEVSIRDSVPDFSVKACDSFARFTAVEQLSIVHHSLSHINFLSHLTACHDITMQWVLVTQPLAPNCFANAVSLDLSHSKQLAHELVSRVEIIASMTLLQTITLQHCDLVTLSWMIYFNPLPQFVSCDIGYNDKVCTEVETVCGEFSKGTASKLKGLDTLHCDSSPVTTEEGQQKIVNMPAYCQTTEAPRVTAPTVLTTYPVEPRTAEPRIDEEKRSYTGLIVGLVLGVLLLLLLIGLVIYFCKSKSPKRETERLVPKDLPKK